MSNVLRMGAALAALLVVIVPSLARARDVRRCGITIAAGKTGKLIEDVQCRTHCIDDPTVGCVMQTPSDEGVCPLPNPNSGCDADVITLGRNATLDLNGFTFTPMYMSRGIVCSDKGSGRCTIKGPGTIAGGKEAAIVPGNMSLVLQDLTVQRFYRSHRFAQERLRRRCDDRSLDEPLGDRVIAREERHRRPGCGDHGREHLPVQFDSDGHPRIRTVLQDSGRA